MSINNLYATELEDLENFNEEEKQRFQVKDMATLMWTLRKLSAIDAKIREVSEYIDLEIERLEQFHKQEVEKYKQSEDFFKALIIEFAAYKRDEDPTFKTQKTPYGTIGFRKQQPKWNYDDEKLIKHLEAIDQHHLIRTKKEPIKTEIKKLFKLMDDGRVMDDSGCFVDGINVEYLPDILDIKPLEV